MLVVACAERAYAQFTFEPVVVAFPHIAIGNAPLGQSYTALIQVVNNNSSSITGHIQFLSDSGAPLSVSFDGQMPLAEQDITLGPGGTRQIPVTLDATITTGWLKITYSPSDASTTVLLQFRSGSTVLSEIGINPAIATPTTYFATVTGAGINTGIAIANPNLSDDNYVQATLWDTNSAAPIASSVITLPPSGHTARLLTELFPNVPNLSGMRKVSLGACGDSSCASPGGSPFFAAAVRLNGTLLTTIPVGPGRQSGIPRVRTVPQVAFGGPANGLYMKTVLYLTTNLATGIVGTADLLDDSGHALQASVNGSAPAASIPFTVPGNRVIRLELTGDQTLHSGWLRVTLPSTLEAAVPDDQLLVTNTVFQTFRGPALVSETSVQESLPMTTGLINVNVFPETTNVGVAIANPQGTPSAIHCTLFDEAGSVAASRDIILPAYGHLASFVTELFPQMVRTKFDGALSIHSTTPVSSVALRATSDQLAALPVAVNGMYRPSLTGLRIIGTQAASPQVTFQIDVTDLDSDIATGTATAVLAVASIDGGPLGYHTGAVMIDGTTGINRTNVTLTGVFAPPDLSGTGVRPGVSSTLHVFIYDAAGDASNSISAPFQF
jgi:hypothetical protein